MFRKWIFALLVLLMSTVSYAKTIDWNEKEINWHDYDSGLAELQKKNQVGIIILYADWCSVCKHYSKLFKEEDVIAAVKGVTLIKANADFEEKVKLLNEYDQKYVPKTIVIEKHGKIVPGIFDEEEDFSFFLPADDADVFLELVKIVKDINVVLKDRIAAK